ncbi:hypothetical protein NE237_021338 [Protea cynaroides]|uniref:D-isomer specific 2-hydroxyacid dehydrogenase catalytic domain-containing protein n=1 Tax=Protea cynaroides TaxID=273540 RepID=A0A9Q0K4S8_9MAGN|nr:hypothetical protein NE237_021338 [Protea cynaroides]
MESFGVMMLPPLFPYLEEEIDKRFKLFRGWKFPENEFLKENSNSIRALVHSASARVDAVMIDMLPKLEIVANYSFGLDKVDFVKCKEKDTILLACEQSQTLFVNLSLQSLQSSTILVRGNFLLCGDFVCCDSSILVQGTFCLMLEEPQFDFNLSFISLWIYHCEL